MKNENIVVHKPKPTALGLKKLYDTCNKIFKNDNLFYTSEEVKNLKKDNKNVFIKGA